jgi:predicted dehydrogenase
MTNQSAMPSSDLTSNRRSFLKQTAAAAASVSFPAVVRSASPNSMVQVASVGANGMAFSDIKNIASHPKVKYVAFCDVDSTRFDKADAEVAGVPHYADFREMLEKLGDKVDAINVGTPDHMHALPAIEAMKRGKHVYCQKPLAHTVWEARQMRLWAEKTGVITQMGNQIHSAIEYRLGTTLIKQGAIGKIKEVHSWIGVSGNERTRLLEPPKKGGTPPSTLNWDLWIGGAPMREFVQDTYHPFVWRDWQDFGGGGLGDFGCHVLDPVFTALDLKAPISVVADNSGINSHIWPVNETVRWIFPKNDLIAGDTLSVTWTDGGLKPSRKIAQMPPELDLPGGGSIFVGEKGNMVLAHVAGPRLYPAQKFQGFEYPKLEKIASHWHRWIDGIIENKKTTDGFHYAGWLAETVQLGNVATRLATRPADSRGGHDIESEHATVLKWDAEALKFTNHAEADKLLTKEYREGWKVTAA